MRFSTDMVRFPRTILKSAALEVYKRSGLSRIQESVLNRNGQGHTSILLFHRVTDEIPEDGITIGTKVFRDICQMLQQEFRVVPLAEVFRLLRSREAFPAKTLAITFDDCYFDNLAAAHTLTEYKLPASFFIPSAHVGTNHVFDWDAELPVRLKNLSWSEVREIADLGFDIGSHTHTHANMATLTDAEAMSELRTSKQCLEDQLGKPVSWFAFPFGSRDHYLDHQLDMVLEAGYKGCVSACPGFIYPTTEDAILPREAVPYFDSVLNLELHLKGQLDWLYSFKKQLGFQ